jgi:predicted DNA-binding transcriptional regulator AlpA
MSTQYLRKAQVATRYCTTKRWVDKMVEEGRLPKPTYPTSYRVPLWNEAELDQHDRAVVVGERHRKTKTFEGQAEI